jgi:hypothetical protein
MFGLIDNLCTPDLMASFFESKADARRRRKFELAEKLNDNAMLICALGYYVRRLKPGKWVRLPPLRRAKGRRMSANWLRHFAGARRVLKLKVRWADGENGKRYLEYYQRIPDPTGYLALNFGLAELPKVSEIKLTRELEELSLCYPSVLGAVQEFLRADYTEAQAAEVRRLAREEQARLESLKFAKDVAGRDHSFNPRPLKPVSISSAIRTFVNRLLDA